MKTTHADTPPDHFEVLPPEGKGGAPGTRGPGGQGGIKQAAVSYLIAYLMDNVIKIPGTKKRLGVNPFLDLIPIVGDGAATLVQLFTIFESMRRGVPKIVLARMGLNIVLNGAVGTVPVVGEAFAWWFRPSSRNYQLLLKHAPQSGGASAAVKRQASAGDYLFVFGLGAAILVIMGMFIFIGWLVLKALWNVGHYIAYPDGRL